MQDYINPQEFLDRQKQKLADQDVKNKRFPIEAEKDVMKFLVEHAPLDSWESDVLSIIREEAYYFAPQGQTKIMNEGWASYWHSKILTTRVLDGSEIIDFADINAGVLASAPGRLNPYKLGIELYRDIEDRWNKGKFGKEWDDCDDLQEKVAWDRELGLGQEKIFQVRKLYNDVTFIDEFLTEEFIAENNMYTFGYNNKSGHWEIDGKQFQDVKSKLLDQLTNFGNPFIYVKDGNYKNRSELLLHHKHLGTDLDMSYARGVLKALHRVWKRPVNIETFFDDKGLVLSFDGAEYTESATTYERI